MKRTFALIITVIMLITSFSNCIVTYADEDNRVYLGTTTCYNIPYSHEFRTDGDIAQYIVLNSFQRREYYFVAEKEGLYSFVINDNPDENSYVKASSDKGNKYLNYVSRCIIYYLEKGEKLSFSHIREPVQNYHDYYYFENGNCIYYNESESYNVTISECTDDFEINPHNTSTYTASNIKGDYSRYLVNAQNCSAKLLGFVANPEGGRSSTITLPSTILGLPINAMGEYAFYGVSYLEEIIIPKTVTSIDNYAFTNCYKLKRVIIENPDCVYSKDSFFACRNDLQIIGGRMGDVSSGATESVSITSADILGVKNKTYTGKEITQKIAVAIDYESLTNGEDYTVSYSNNKKVGTATITVTGIGNYYGNIKKTFKINPKGTSIKSISARSKGFYLKWNKQATQTSGYQIKYSTDKNFGKNNKTIDVSSNKTTSKTVKKLSKSKKYYVKVRTYKIVNGKAYFSAWSSAKSIKTKR